jgi:uncharacterized membrane protein YfcA
MFTVLTLYILAVVFLSTAIRSWLGFGQALVALPLLVLRMRMVQAVPLVLLVSLVVALVMLAQDWRHLHLRGLGWLMVGAAVGVPLGYCALKYGNPRYIKGAFAILLILFSLYSLLGRLPPELKKDSPALITGAGLIAGLLGGAFGINSPPLAVYGAMRRWNPQKFRATLQVLLVPLTFMEIAVLFAGGMYDKDVMWYSLYSLPVMVLAVYLGRAASLRLKGAVFYKCVYVLLVVIGIDLLHTAFFHS